MGTTFPCPACGQVISADVSAGTQVQCPLCNQVVSVPGDASMPAAQKPVTMPYSTGPEGPVSKGMAIGALVCGIVGIVACMPLGIVGIILGIVALNRSSSHPERYGGRGLAIAGICTGGASIFSVALMISILLPSLSRARELSKRTVCAANLRGIGQAMYIYAQDEPYTFPAIGAAREQNDGAMVVFDPAMRTGGPSIYETPSPTVDMWAVIRANNAMPKLFICPSTIDVEDTAWAWDTEAYYDFLSPINLSYAYQYQHDPNRRTIGTSSDPAFPIMADANPYIKGGMPGGTFASDRQSQFRGNSVNHTNREGQNVLYQDGHVAFEKGPDVGLSGRVAAALRLSRGQDNCYTVHAGGGSTTVDPGSAAPTATSCNLGGKSDACLVP
ncbi:MAG: DUF4190 domain-containing protein [Phycisphaerae bacterium]|nr:DUF4190 domain-containing protein [Phycisphaerae bacterium]